MKTLFLFFAIVYSWPSAFAASPCENLVGSCEYYSCLSANLGCTAQDYTEKLGLHYCNAFNEQLDQYTEQGQTFILTAEVCLQKQIEANFKPTTTCADFSRAAPQQHAECYGNSGFCELPLRDKVRIAHLVAGVYLEWLGQSAGTTIELARMCVDQTL